MQHVDGAIWMSRLLPARHVQFQFSHARTLWLASCVLAASLAVSSARAEDEPGTKDGPIVGRYAGSRIAYQKNGEFDEVALLKAPHDYGALLEKNTLKDRSGSEWLQLEGRVSRTRYEIPAGRSALEVLRNYQNALKSGGFQLVFECSDKNCLTGKLQDSYLLGEQLDPENNVSTSYSDHARYALLRRSANGADVYAAILVGEDKERTTAFVETVEVKEMESDKVQVMSSSELGQAIATTGKVAVYGLLFDYDKAVLKPESKPTLDEIAKLLTEKPKLRLDIVGHTDNRGAPEYNLDLSSRRAQSVAAALTHDYAIAADRLRASGAGLTRPVAPNDTEEGRAKNRRVELVAQ
ncbi:OmpA family protein [Methylocystis parvus]|nr:OmpA family protein [Methylocystis parvus]